MILLKTKIPIAIHPLFWLTAGMIGWMYSYGQGIYWILVWIAIIFFSVLFHELGHAITATVFKQKAKIQLVLLGGLTSYEGPKLSFWQQFLIVLNGPVFGFILSFASYGLVKAFPFAGMLSVVFAFTWKANLFWSLANLLPVLPLDGGQLLRIALEGFFGLKGFRASLLFGAVFAALLSFACFTFQQFLLGAFLFLFAFQSYDTWRKSRHATSSDRDDENKKKLMDAEMLLQEGKKQEAKALLLQVRERTKGGMLADAAAQYLAFLAFEEGNRDMAYDLLLPIEAHISDEARCLLHKLAAEKKNYALIAKLSTECYQIAPSQEMALHNARAFAFLNQPKFAGGWLQTACQYGGLDLTTLLLENEFAQLKDNSEFQTFIRALE
ncbi:MAG: hypothetical protein HY069_02535 [Chlamydiia bacterium]|nr:hypothetical protein [Chlamydiia bacterium]